MGRLIGFHAISANLYGADTRILCLTPSSRRSEIAAGYGIDTNWYNDQLQISMCVNCFSVVALP